LTIAIWAHEGLLEQGVAGTMAINILPVSRDDVQRILNIDESHFGDVKSIDIAPSKLTRTLSAFANADGGEIFIGIDEDKAKQKKTWRGFANQEAANAHIQVLNDLFPLGEDYSYEFMLPAVRNPNGFVLHVIIQKSQGSRMRQMASHT
jgi:ATP-dependent DNA helicase RecG